MAIIWKDLPEINRKIAFNFNYTSSGMSLGCHCGSLSGVSATFGARHWAINDGKNIEVLDKTKEPPIKYTRQYSYENASAPKEEYQKVADHLRALKLTFSDLDPDGYTRIIEKCSTVPLWVMSDVINYDAPARKPPQDKDFYEVYGHTVDFVKYLIDNKIGCIVSSPVVQNPVHRMRTNYSLNQGWFWIPPKHMMRAINVAEMHGEEQFPSKESWLQTVGNDIGKPVETSDDILKAVLSGVFPERSRRFNNRAADGRFAKVNEA